VRFRILASYRALIDSFCAQEILRGIDIPCCVPLQLKLTKFRLSQLYEDDAKIGHQEFDLKLTNRVKMCMVRVICEIAEPILN
jgi:hypothetical protein